MNVSGSSTNCLGIHVSPGAELALERTHAAYCDTLTVKSLELFQSMARVYSAVAVRGGGVCKTKGARAPTVAHRRFKTLGCQGYPHS